MFSKWCLENYISELVGNNESHSNRDVYSYECLLDKVRQNKWSNDALQGPKTQGKNQT